jgi:hypothetical protein
MTATNFCLIVLTIWLAQAKAQDKSFLDRMVMIWVVLASFSLVLDIASRAAVRWS